MPKNYSFITLANNKPSMDELRGELEGFTVSYPDTTPTVRYVLTLNPGFDIPRDWEKASFALDNGLCLKLYYVAGYSQDKTKLYLDPVSGGSSRYRGPAKTYFLTIREMSNNNG